MGQRLGGGHRSGTELAWAALGGDPALTERVSYRGPSGLLAARLPVMDLARSTVAVCALAAAELAARRDGGPVPAVRVDDGAVATAFVSERHLRIDGRVPSSFAPLSRFWRTADGWVRTHANYPHHRGRLLSGLGLPESAGVPEVEAELAGRDAAEKASRYGWRSATDPPYDLPVTTSDHYLARGPRVGIRHFTAADREEFTAAARESAELHRPWLFPPATDAAYDGYLLKLQEPLREGFLICELTSGRIAGYLTINNIVHGAFQCGAIGYGAFAHAAGRGLMSAGLRLVLRHAFGALGLHRLEVNIQPANELSLALVKRAGFRLEGFSPDFLFIDGAWRDHERWAITSEMIDDGTA